MARLLEYRAKACLRDVGVSVPKGIVVRTPPEAASAALTLGGPVILKAQVPLGRRGKRGGVLFADAPSDAHEVAAQLLGQPVGEFPVEEILVEQALAVEQEAFFSVTLDKRRHLPVAMASKFGGVNVEEALASAPETMHEVELDPRVPPFAYSLRELWRRAGFKGRLILELADLSLRVVRLFYDFDATTIEINPIGIRSAPSSLATNGSDISVCALSAVIAVDDNALARHPELAEHVIAGTDLLWRPPTALERRAMDLTRYDPHRGTVRFIQLRGDIGFLCGGGGGSLVLFDGVVRAGGQPACYSEFGGNPTAEKTRELARIVLSCPGIRGLLVGHNITNNTQIQLVAEGVVGALADMNLNAHTFPVVAREVGTYDREGRAIFERAGIEYLDEEVTLEIAAKRIVDRVSAVRAVS